MPNHAEKALDPREIIEAIATGSLPPGDAFVRLRDILCSSAGTEIQEGTYEALRSLVWSFVSSREAGEQLDLWADVILRVRQLLRTKESPLAERFTVLADFLEQSGRFSRLHPKEELRARKHVAAILKILASQEAPVERSTIARETKLRDANLSRVLANLTSAGWITRRNQGREVVIGLTHEGASQARDLTQADAVTAAEGPFGNEKALGVVKSLWKQTGCALAITDDKAGLLSCDENFASLFSIPDPQMLYGKDVKSLRKSVADMASSTDEVAPEEVAMADGRVLSVVEHSTRGKSLWLGFDVTPYKRRLEEFKRRERLLLREIEHLKASASSRSPIRRTEPSAGLAEAIWPLFAALRNDVLTPINSINSFAQLLSTEAVSKHPSSNYDELLKSIVIQSNQLRTLMRDIVNVGEFFETTVAARDNVRPTDLVADVVHNLSYTARHSRVSLSMAPSDTPAVQIDERALRAVLLQAVSGIVEMTPTGGRVTIGTAVDKESIVMSVSTPSMYPDFSAVGIASKTLTFCEHAVRHFGGEFDFSSRTGRGISAKFSWPVHPVSKKGLLSRTR